MDNEKIRLCNCEAYARLSEFMSDLNDNALVNEFQAVMSHIVGELLSHRTSYSKDIRLDDQGEITLTTKGMQQIMDEFVDQFI